MTTDERLKLLQGTLDMLVLRTLLFGPTHGHGIAQSIQRASEETLYVDHGSLYPALHRLLGKGWITWEKKTTPNSRVAKFYRLTDEGREQLTRETARWDSLCRAIARVMSPGEET